MATYWVNFHLHDDAAYRYRYEALINVIANSAVNEWWDETTSFIVFESNLSIGVIANKISMTIDELVDTVVLGQPEFKSMRLIGLKRNFEALQRLVPFVK